MAVSGGSQNITTGVEVKGGGIVVTATGLSELFSIMLGISGSGLSISDKLFRSGGGERWTD